MSDENRTKDLIAKLECLSLELRSQILHKAVLQLVIFLSGGLMLMFVLDLLVHFPYMLRLMIIFVGAGSILRCFIRGPYKKYKEEITAEKVSLLIEKEFPEFRSRLISTLQFNSTVPGRNVSVELIDGMNEQTFRMIKQVSLGKIVDRTWKKKTYRNFFGVLVLSIVLISSLLPSFFVFLNRLLLPVNYPTKTQLVSMEIPKYVIAEEDGILRLKARGLLPPMGTVIVKTKNDTLDVDLEKTDQRGHYECRLSGIIEDSFLEVKLGDYESKSVALPVVMRPAIAKLKMHLLPPKYTGISAYSEDSANLRVPFGTKVRLEITATKKLVELKWLIKKNVDKLPEFIQEDGKWYCEFTAVKDVSYSFLMKDEIGLESKAMPDFRITVKKDKKPRIRVLKPLSLNELAPNSSMEFQVKISDDYKLSSVRVLYLITRGESDDIEATQEYSVRQKIDVESAEYELREVWKNRGLGLEEGDSLRIRIEATDASPQKNVAISQDIMVPIISAAELKSRLSDEFLQSILPAEDNILQIKDSMRKTKKLGNKQ